MIFNNIEAQIIILLVPALVFSLSFHEFAHAVEKVIEYEIYSDGSIESEFLSKRHKLEVLLNYQGLKTDQYNFSNPNL